MRMLIDRENDKHITFKSVRAESEQDALQSVISSLESDEPPQWDSANVVHSDNDNIYVVKVTGQVADFSHRR